MKSAWPIFKYNKRKNACQKISFKLQFCIRKKLPEILGISGLARLQISGKNNGGRTVNDVLKLDFPSNAMFNVDQMTNYVSDASFNMNFQYTAELHPKHFAFFGKQPKIPALRFPVFILDQCERLIKNPYVFRLNRDVRVSRLRRYAKQTMLRARSNSPP
jgi:hypothetical protein